MKRLSIYALIGMTLGIALASWLGPKVLLWWFEPPADIGINYRPAIEWAMNRLLWIQIGGVSLGLILGVMVGLAIRRSPKTT
jgi:hypothetical protein